MSNDELIAFLTEALYVSHYESVRVMHLAAQRLREQGELLEKVLADNKRLNDAAAFLDAWKADAV